MRKDYDFTKSRMNPYPAKPKKQITIRPNEDAIAHFKAVSQEIGPPPCIRGGRIPPIVSRSTIQVMTWGKNLA